MHALLRRIWRGDGLVAAVGRAALWPLTLPYRLGLHVNRGRLARRPRFPPGIPVVSVGNVTVGGTGKTPVVAWVAAELRRAGRHPVIVSRGYGGRRRADPMIVSDGRKVLRSPAEAGDEPVMLARMLPRVPVVVGRDRVAAARLAVARLRADVVILDDGFQQRGRFPGALHLVTVDGRRPDGNGSLLPAGPLREPLTALAAADVVLARGGLAPAVRRRLHAAGVRATVMAWRYELRSLRALAGTSELAPAEWLGGQRVLAASGLGNPDGFVELLERQRGIGRVERFDMPDHHAWTAADVEDVARAAVDAGCGMIVTTEKDAVKWPRKTPASLPLFVANAGLRLAGETGLRTRLRAYVRAGAR